MVYKLYTNCCCFLQIDREKERDNIGAVMIYATLSTCDHESDIYMCSPYTIIL